MLSQVFIHFSQKQCIPLSGSIVAANKLSVVFILKILIKIKILLNYTCTDKS